MILTRSVTNVLSERPPTYENTDRAEQDRNIRNGKIFFLRSVGKLLRINLVRLELHCNYAQHRPLTEPLWVPPYWKTLTLHYGSWIQDWLNILGPTRTCWSYGILDTTLFWMFVSHFCSLCWLVCLASHPWPVWTFNPRSSQVKWKREVRKVVWRLHHRATPLISGIKGWIGLRCIIYFHFTPFTQATVTAFWI